jgi:DNA repair protein RecO (recombination protein O)
LGVFKDGGIVIDECPSAEYDKSVTLLLRGRGRIIASARGARRPGSKYFAGTQLFSCCDFTIFDGGGFFALTEAVAVRGFYGVAADCGRFESASAMLELARAVILPGAPAGGYVSLLYNALNALVSGVDPEYALCAFRLRFLKLEGVEPELSRCVFCGDDRYARLSAQGLVCGDCAAGDAIKINEKTAQALNFVLNLNNPFKYGVNAERLRPLSEAAAFLADRAFGEVIKKETPRIR